MIFVLLFVKYFVHMYEHRMTIFHADFKEINPPVAEWFEQRLIRNVVVVMRRLIARCHVGSDRKNRLGLLQ